MGHLMTDKLRGRIQGIAAALAEVQRSHGEDTIVVNALDAFGLDLADFEKAGVEDFDLSQLRAALKSHGR